MMIFWVGEAFDDVSPIENGDVPLNVSLLEGRWSERWCFCNLGVALMDRTRKTADGCACWRAEDRAPADKDEC